MDIVVDGDNTIPNSTESVLMKVFGDRKVSFMILLIAVVGIYVGIFLIAGTSGLGSINTSTSPTSVLSKNLIIIILEIFLWAFLIFIVYINIKNYDDQNLDFQAKLENLFNAKLSELTVNVNSNTDSVSDSSGNTNSSESEESSEECKNANEDDSGKEVFHIAENVFNYKEAKEICEKYDARLATYDEIEKAYENGASWCSYGWSDEQMAFFPTQKKVYNTLKKIEGHKNDCGRPGINGGYISNAKVKFGANCYGIKPSAKDTDKDYMHRINHSPAVSKQDIAKANEESNSYKSYVVAPFNKDKWSSI